MNGPDTPRTPGTPTRQTRAVERFACLQEHCPHTCCGGWSMQVDELTAAGYSGGGLRDFLMQEEGRTVMRRSIHTGECLALHQGRCTLHATHGPDILGEACFFYPRVVRQVGDELRVSATLSCPEVARLSLADDDATETMPAAPAARTPESMRRYEASAWAEHEAFMEKARQQPAARAVREIVAACAGEPAPVAGEAADACRIVHVLAAMAFTSGEPMHPRLAGLLAQLQQRLGMAVDAGTLDLLVPDPERWARTAAPPVAAPLQRRFLRAYLSAMAFPLAGPGATRAEKARVLAYRFAVTQLALRAVAPPDLEGAVLVVQELARALDQVASGARLLRLMEAAGLGEVGRVLGVIDDR